MTKLLVPGNVECIYFKLCKQRSYQMCLKCKNNNIAILKRTTEKSKQDYFSEVK